MSKLYSALKERDCVTSEDFKAVNPIHKAQAQNGHDRESRNQHPTKRETTGLSQGLPRESERSQRSQTLCC